MADSGDSIVSNLRLQSRQSKQILHVLGSLFLYSVAMFTFPFVAFYGVRSVLTTSFPDNQFLINCWSVGAAVLVVNIIIGLYCYKAYHEKEYDEDGNEIDQHAYTDTPLPSLATAEKKSTLNLKQD